MHIRTTLIAAGLSLVAFSSLQAAPADLWLAGYYRNPQPNHLIQGTIQLTQSGYFSTPRENSVALGFYATVFRQNPAWVNTWLNEAATLLPDHVYRIFVAAAWESGNALGARRMAELNAYTRPSLRPSIASLEGRGPSPLADLAVDSQDAMNVQWGAYLASGNQRYVLNILAALGSNQPGVAAAARYELAQEAASDPRVMTICQDQLNRQPHEISTQIEAALNSARSGDHPGQPGT